MMIAFTSEQRALRDRLRAYMAQRMTPALREELTQTEAGGPEYHRAMQRLGADGWLGIGWPVEAGGQGRPLIEQYIFFDEVQRAGFPIPLLTLNTVGPTLIRYGTQAQRDRFLPAILQGRCHFSIGYTEPSAGTDLARLRTRAVRKGQTYVVSGQKIWNSLADHADFFWLAVRTDPEASRHAGISILIVPRETPGVSMTPMTALGGNNVHAVYFDEVIVPVDNLVGKENQGWTLITAQLNHERVALMSVGPLARLARETLAWASAAPDGHGGCVLDTPWVRQHLARVEARLEGLRLLNWQQAWKMDSGDVLPADASVIKVMGSELYVEAYRLLMEVVGEAGVLRVGSRGAALHGELERYARATLVLTFGGGTNEVQRDIIAQTGMGIPRGRR